MAVKFNGYNISEKTARTIICAIGACEVFGDFSIFGETTCIVLPHYFTDMEINVECKRALRKIFSTYLERSEYSEESALFAIEEGMQTEQTIPDSNLQSVIDHIEKLISEEEITNGLVEFISNIFETCVKMNEIRSDDGDYLLAGDFFYIMLNKTDLLSDDENGLTKLTAEMISYETNGEKDYYQDGADGEMVKEITAENLNMGNGFNPFELTGGMIGMPINIGANEVEDSKEVFEKYCTNLIEEVKDDKRILVGREKEIDETIRIMCRKNKANPLHLGEAGVGKTEITLGLARSILENKVPESLKDSEIYSLSITSLMAGTTYRGQLEARVDGLVKELKKRAQEADHKIILYIDEIHMICGGSNHDDPINISNMLKPLLTDGKVRVIGATTYDEYKKFIESDKALARRFKVVRIDEPSAEEAKQILKGIAPIYEEYHNVKYSKEAINEMVDLSVKYINDKKLPDKAIDLMDEAGAEISKSHIIYNGNKDKSNKQKKKHLISSKDIDKIISITCGIPMETVEEDEIDILKNIDNNIKNNLFGQDTAIKECTDVIKLNRLGLSDGNKPIGTLLFVGPTGVGKTELAIQIKNEMGMDLVRLDMSEYSDQTAVNKLIGASAGYVGYEDSATLVEEIRRHPNCVLLLDEIEKAHPSVFNALLQVMDTATLTDNKGRKANFKNVLIIMTSNAGARDIKRKGMGFGEELSYLDNSAMKKEIEKIFTPEFRARITKVIEFNELNDEMAYRIIKKSLEELEDSLKERNIKVKYSDDVIEKIRKMSINKDNGAREVKNVIEREVKMLFVDWMLKNNISKSSNKKSITANLEVNDNNEIILK